MVCIVGVFIFLFYFFYLTETCFQKSSHPITAYLVRTRFCSYFKQVDAREIHFAFYPGVSGRIGLNLHFKCDVKSDLSLFTKYSDGYKGPISFSNIILLLENYACHGVLKSDGRYNISNSSEQNTVGSTGQTDLGIHFLFYYYAQIL